MGRSCREGFRAIASGSAAAGTTESCLADNTKPCTTTDTSKVVSSAGGQNDVRNETMR